MPISKALREGLIDQLGVVAHETSAGNIEIDACGGWVQIDVDKLASAIAAALNKEVSRYAAAK